MSTAVSRPAPPLTLHAERIGDKAAVIDDRPKGWEARPPDGRVTAWTFAELNRQANRLAHALIGLGVRPGDKVVWCGQNSPGEVRAIHAGMPGEMFIRSTNAFVTYKADDKRLAASRGDFCSVGDVAYRDDEGYYYICDRKHDMIITGGMNVYPAEVEATLERHPDVLDVAVFGIPSETWGESVHAVVGPRPDAALTADALVDFARRHVAAYKAPRSVTFADALPRTGSGKILKRLLREPYWRAHARRVG